MRKHIKTMLTLTLFLASFFSVGVSEQIDAHPSDALSVNAYPMGTHVLFGRYEQDNDLSNGQEPLEWVVLDQSGEKVLLITRYIIDFGYNGKAGLTSPGPAQTYRWANSTLRQWLNDEFIDMAFDTNEQASLLSTTVKAEKSPFNDYAKGQDTEDKVFTLSYSEAYQYFKTNDDRIAEPSLSIKHYPFCSVGQMWRDGIMYESNRRVITSYTWSLRAPGKETYAVIGSNGKATKSFGWQEYIGLRPTCWIDASTLNGNLVAPAEEPFISPEITVGSEIQFGKFQPLSDFVANGEPISWIVVAREYNKILLLSKQVLSMSHFSNEKRATWDQSMIRTWLNGEFLESSFSTEEQQAMAIRTVLAEKSGAGKTTFDKLFLLSRSEMEMLMPNFEYRIAYRLPPIDESNQASYSWWLRSSEWGSQYADVVNSNGEINCLRINQKEPVGIRPVCWLNLDAINLGEAENR